MPPPEDIIELECGHNYVDYSAVHNVRSRRLAPSLRVVCQHDVLQSN